MDGHLCVYQCYNRTGERNQRTLHVDQRRAKCQNVTKIRMVEKNTQNALQTQVSHIRAISPILARYTRIPSHIPTSRCPSGKVCSYTFTPLTLSMYHKHPKTRLSLYVNIIDKLYLGKINL